MGRRFGADARIRKRPEFLRVREKGLERHGRGFLLQCAPGGPEQTRPRLGVIVTKRLGNAVVRNRAKRVFRALFRSCGAERYPVADWVVVVRKGYLGQNHAALSESWNGTLDSLGRKLMALGNPSDPESPRNDSAGEAS
ncbi:MAG: ribonuclease P protein component [Puniceicoccaceae bacterium]